MQTPGADPDGRRPTTAARTSPSADRAVRILLFLSGEPLRSFKMAEITRSLEISHASAHAVLASLEQAGFVRRDPRDRTFTLGPTLIALGSAARKGVRVVDVARPRMQSLSDELALECHAGIRVDDEILVVARTGVRQPFGLGVEVGQRLPLVPPLGTPYVAWSGADAVESYLRRAAPDRRPEQLERYRQAIAAVRRRGYAVALDAETRQRFGELAAKLADHPGADLRPLEEAAGALLGDDYLLLEIEGAARYDVTGISAPVFGADGSVVLVVGVVGFGRGLPAPRIPDLAGRVMATAALITGDIRGRPLAPAGGS
jgi:DNA-binding IclR family transcriptional regulator